MHNNYKRIPLCTASLDLFKSQAKAIHRELKKIMPGTTIGLRQFYDICAMALGYKGHSDAYQSNHLNQSDEPLTFNIKLIPRIMERIHFAACQSSVSAQLTPQIIDHIFQAHPSELQASLRTRYTEEMTPTQLIKYSIFNTKPANDSQHHGIAEWYRSIADNHTYQYLIASNSLDRRTKTVKKSDTYGFTYTITLYSYN